MHPVTQINQTVITSPISRCGWK